MKIWHIESLFQKIGEKEKHLKTIIEEFRWVKGVSYMLSLKQDLLDHKDDFAKKSREEVKFFPDVNSLANWANYKDAAKEEINKNINNLRDKLYWTLERTKEKLDQIKSLYGQLHTTIVDYPNQKHQSCNDFVKKFDKKKNLKTLAGNSYSTINGAIDGFKNIINILIDEISKQLSSLDEAKTKFDTAYTELLDKFNQLKAQITKNPSILEDTTHLEGLRAKAKDLENHTISILDALKTIQEKLIFLNNERGIQLTSCVALLP